MASKVLRLNSRVPTNWVAALHQDGSAPHRRPRLSVASLSSRPAASVKKIEPAKKTTPSAPGPTRSTNPGNGPTKKHTDPAAKPTGSSDPTWREQPGGAPEGARDRSRSHPD